MLCEKYGVSENNRKRMMGHSLGAAITNAKYGHRPLEELRYELEKIKCPCKFVANLLLTEHVFPILKQSFKACPSQVNTAEIKGLKPFSFHVRHILVFLKFKDYLIILALVYLL